MRKGAADDLRRTALYYPEIAIPSGKWLRQATLYFDEVASIVPSGMELLTQKELEDRVRVDPHFDKYLARVSEDVGTLRSAGQYRPIDPAKLIEYSTEEREEFGQDFLSALLSPAFQQSLGDRKGWLYDAPIHILKGFPDLFDLLVQEGYAQRGKDGTWIDFERSTAHLYMSILAKYLARQDAEDTLPCTSGEDSSFNDISFRIGEKANRMCVAELVFKNALPCPKPDSAIADILAFKDKRRAQLMEFRKEVDALEKEITAADTPEAVKQSVRAFAEKKELALLALNRTFAETFTDGVWQSLRSLVRLGSPTLWLAGFAAAQAKGITIQQLPPSVMLKGAAVTGAIEVGLTFVERFRQRRDIHRSSALSYVYYFEKELVKKRKR
jgi:hypothetical protein